jgi:HD-GYP domain-containing protein (c-di-GMP phosphodiesterase class II)
MRSTDNELDQANPHALAAIVEASSKRTIVASDDIVDERGVKLWARGQPVSESLQQRLLERKLKQPLEATLEAADGVNGPELKQALAEFLGSEHALARVLQTWGPKLLAAVGELKLQSVAQLLLTAAQAARPGIYEHAVRGMVLAGAMSLAAKADRAQLDLALMGGLLHDLGEMYVNPDYLNPQQPLDIIGYRHMAVHPRTGALLLTRLAKYPATLARGVAEHHERLDGSGYPGRSSGAAISPLGRQLAVVEVVLGVMAQANAPWARASFALRMVPGEFDGLAVGFITNCARQAGEPLMEADDLALHGLNLVDGRLVAALAQADELERSPSSAAAVRAVAGRASHLLFRLRAGWNEMGLWAADTAEPSAEVRAEMSLAGRELAYRMRFIRRECLWAEKELGDADAAALAPLWASLDL